MPAGRELREDCWTGMRQPVQEQEAGKGDGLEGPPDQVGREAWRLLVAVPRRGSRRMKGKQRAEEA